MSCKVVVGSLLVAVVAFGMASLANADSSGFDYKSSTDFSWKYEMDALPSAQDKDGNSTLDFNFVAGDGSATIVSGGLDGNVLRLVNSKANGNGFFNSDNATTGQLWPAQGFSYAGGYTIEARMKIISQDSGADGVFGLAALPSGTSQWAAPGIASTGEVWSGGTSYTHTNTDDFHVFRFAQAPGATSYTVWRDNEVLGTGLGSSMVYAQGPQLYFGDGAGSYGGTVDMDYLRLTAGAWSPNQTPEPSMLALLTAGLVSLLAYAWRKRK
jgi:hypothetical protein